MENCQQPSRGSIAGCLRGPFCPSPACASASPRLPFPPAPAEKQMMKGDRWLLLVYLAPLVAGVLRNHLHGDATHTRPFIKKPQGQLHEHFLIHMWEELGGKHNIEGRRCPSPVACVQINTQCLTQAHHPKLCVAAPLGT